YEGCRGASVALRNDQSIVLEQGDRLGDRRGRCRDRRCRACENGRAAGRRAGGDRTGRRRARRIITPRKR
ncbi:hypothetical protein IAI13_37355, partial [Escherichia coli]|nr:hypothetical protein [Escherichia coli]